MCLLRPPQTSSPCADGEISRGDSCGRARQQGQVLLIALYDYIYSLVRKTNRRIVERYTPTSMYILLCAVSPQAPKYRKVGTRPLVEESVSKEQQCGPESRSSSPSPSRRRTHPRCRTGRRTRGSTGASPETPPRWRLSRRCCCETGAGRAHATACPVVWVFVDKGVKDRQHTGKNVCALGLCATMVMGDLCVCALAYHLYFLRPQETFTLHATSTE